ncbi:MAG TPA: translation factor GTPase family protein [Friedmanniella sp.]
MHRSPPVPPRTAAPADPPPEAYLDLGVLAHVDAGKTSLTEALLVAGGALDHVGRVDDGTTKTDTLAQERRRGITIRAAVATFRAGGVVVNLVDTPGHPDFIAEVDRSLAVLDGAVLVVSAVEGVQAQTVVLHRALRRLRVPTVVFVNKTDRAGADPDRVVAEVAARLDADLVPTRWADPRVVEAVTATLAEHDDALLRRWLEQGRLDAPTLRQALRRLTRACAVQPVVLGSARTGAGVPELVDVVTALLTPGPATPGQLRAAARGQVFKVEHDDAGRRVCTVRVRTGTLAVRDRVRLGHDRTGVVTALRVFEPGGPVVRDHVVAGQVAQVSGLAAARVGDDLAADGSADGGTGGGRAREVASAFPPPALQTTVVARDPAQQETLRRALVVLADVDPLIRLRPDPRSGALRIDVYGEVQREVIAETLAIDYGVVADFSPPTAACVERPAGTGTAVRRMGDPGHHRPVTLGVSVAPAVPGSGVQLVVTAPRLTLPLHVYGTVEALGTALHAYVEDALVAGPQGWPVTDLAVTLTESGYPPAGPAPADVRHTLVVVVTEALRAAGTVVCEPVDRFRLEAPTESVAGVTGLLMRHRGRPEATQVRGGTTVLSGTLPSAEVDAVRLGLPTAAHGLAVLESTLDHHAPAPAVT